MLKLPILDPSENLRAEFTRRNNRHRRTTVAENMLVVGGAMGRIDRDGNRANHHNRNVGNRPFGTVFRNYGDTVPRHHPGPSQAEG